MNTITKQQKIKQITEHWRGQYFCNGTWKYCKGGAELIFNQLRQLGAKATEDKIAAIIGNYSWTQNNCDECGQDSEIVATFTEDAEQVTYICPDCLRKGLALCEMVKAQGE